MKRLAPDLLATPPDRRRSAKPGWITAALTGALLCASGASWAQIILFPKPSAPALVDPAPSVLLPGQPNGASVVTFKWNQYGIFSMPSQPLPTHFVVCLQRATAPQTCAWPGTWSMPANSGVPIYFNFRITGYQYTFRAPPPAPDPGIGDSLLDSQMTWIVGSCVGQSSARCSFSAPRNLWLSTKDLRAVDVEQFGSARGLLMATAQADNLGTTASGTTQTQFVLWHVYNDGPGRCLTNVNAGGLSIWDETITNDGSLKRIGDLPTNAAGQRLAPAGIIGIRPSSGLVDFANFNNSPSVPVGATQANLATWERLLSGFGYPASFVVRIYVDSSGALVETNEGNNWRAECLVIN